MQALLTQHGGHHTVISLWGDLDLTTSADELLAQLPALAGVANERIALDLSGVTFLDCGGLRALLALDQRVRGEGGDLYLAAASSAVARVFELLTGVLEFGGLFEPYSSRESVATSGPASSTRWPA